ncbi:MAG: peptide MFS transporter [Paludisphaera borealis]|uniref:peptide MFS transporter n=1 Tax=Paludisphaera borealis TaxID=1387353 RepID=UPI00283AF4E8|nr:peptide MFS transporter [Paludisphaera borealis]MDR3621526.1 peptide MFS transporter [Paludisphaera borealis]
MSQTVETVPPAKLESHPPGLYALFTTEMWERFSFYGMRALLVLYLTKAMGYSRGDALNVYAIYTGLVYLTPLIGGRLADLYLGQRKAVFIGGTLMALGQFALTQRELLPLGLGLMIVGNGFFKPNISVMVGSLYPKGDHRLDGAYTLFYMGINLGALLAPLVSGPLGERVGWPYGFASAGVGMILGLLTFVFTQRLLQSAGLPPGRDAEAEPKLRPADWVEIGVISGVVALGVFGLIRAWPSLQPYWSPAWASTSALSFLYRGTILLGGLLLFILATEPRAKAEMNELHEPFTRADWQRLGVIVTISLFSVVFWMGFEQSGGTLNLFADEKTDRSIFGWTVPTSVFQSANPIFIVTLAPLFAILWTALARRSFPLPSVAKQGLGLVLLSSAFAVMYFADKQSKQGLISPFWLLSVYLIFTVAELFVSPIGLSLVNRLAHPRIASLMMAFWFLCTAAANYLAGIMEHTLEPYHLNLWAFLGAMAFVPGVMMLALTPVLVKMSHGRV